MKFAVTVRVAAASGGSKVTFVASGSGDGRVAELPDDAVLSAVRRLLTRFAEALGTAAEPGAEDVARTEDTEDAEDAGDSTDDSHTSVFETEIPPPSLAPFADLEPEADAAGEDAGFDADVPPAEAAHARRTMIGRSAEEVDHAPPRGRYARCPRPSRRRPPPRCAGPGPPPPSWSRPRSSSAGYCAAGADRKVGSARDYPGNDADRG